MKTKRKPSYSQIENQKSARKNEKNPFFLLEKNIQKNNAQKNTNRNNGKNKATQHPRMIGGNGRINQIEKRRQKDKIGNQNIQLFLFQKIKKSAKTSVPWRIFIKKFIALENIS